MVSRLFPGIANKRGACPPGVLSFFKVTNSVCEAVDTKLIVIRLYWALLCAPERSPSRPNRVDVLDSHVKRPDVSTSGYSGKPRHITGDEERDNAYDRPSAAWRVAARGARHDRHFAS